MQNRPLQEQIKEWKRVDEAGMALDPMDIRNPGKRTGV
jgi:hypothetical protein